MPKKKKTKAEAKAEAEDLLTEFGSCWEMCEGDDGRLIIRPKTVDGKKPSQCKRGEKHVRDFDRMVKAVRKGVVIEE